jgi:hypothetical protein
MELYTVISFNVALVAGVFLERCLMVSNDSTNDDSSLRGFQINDKDSILKVFKV